MLIRCRKSIGSFALAASTALVAASMSAAFAQDEAAQTKATPRVRPSLTTVAAHVHYFRGGYARTVAGFEFTVPQGYHLAENADARELDLAMRGVDDENLIAWIDRIGVPVTHPDARIVRVRWRGDGLISIGADDLDPVKLEAAAARTPVERLASSAGKFVRFVEAPTLRGHLVSWVEERALDGGKASVHDCHAVRLARRGLLEFSLLGAAAGKHVTCAQTLREFTDTLSFDEQHDYPTRAEKLPKAAYTLTDLVTQTK